MKRRLWATAILAVFAIFAVACGDDKEETPSGQTTGTPAPTTTLTPVAGGTITMGTFSETAGLDPIVSSGNGVTGYIEMATIYDTIVRYNTETGKYDNNFAESVTANADSTEWTVKLKSGIKFSDGTAYDAEAVKFGMNRHRSGTTGAPACAELYACPRNSTSSAAYMGIVKSIDVVDPLTVKFTLSEPWTSFPYALSAEASMIPSPTAMKKCDPTKDVRQCDFNIKPVGAGPFTIGSFKAKDSITVVKNPAYFGGTVYLDGITFVNSINDAGGAATLNALNANTLQMAFLRDPATVAAAHDKKYGGVSTMEQAGGIFLINTGVSVTCAAQKPEPLCVGKPDGPTPTNPPTKDLKVRQALAAAIDNKVLNDRGYSGKGLIGSELLQSDFRWSPGVTGPKYDLAKAKQLVTEAKAAGWDGKMRLLYNTSPTAQAIGLAAQTMLQAAGIDASLDVGKDTTAQINQVIVLRDFDVTGWGIAISPDDGALWGLTQNLLSTSSSNRIGYKSTAVDNALKALRIAKTDDEKKALYKTIAENIANDIPVLPFAKIEEFIAWNSKVHGVRQVNRSGVLFDKAWIEK
ncbi:MAG TPA: ABC transporter substrate-binding protein [Acidimicrobiales bacterium]|jgi:peptide/nickel transport system substrate-binding protein|nr:ABC transporter substrate-binding protein [Acidimicrobiales bacterium]